MIAPTQNGPTLNDLQFRYFRGWNPWVLGSTASGLNAPLTILQTLISGNGGRFGGGVILNVNSGVAYIQCFDLTTAVTLGTTVPTFIIPIAAAATAADGLTTTIEIADSIYLSNGLQIAATTTSNGSTTVSTGLTGTILYQ